MYFLLYILHSKKQKQHKNAFILPGLESRIIKYFISTAYVLLIVFSIIAAFKPAWLSKMSYMGKEVEASEAMNFADNFSRKGDFYNAIYEYKRALKIEPDLIPAVSNLAVTYAKMGKFDKAIAILNKALKQNPENPYLIYHNLAQIYLFENHKDKAIDYYKKTLKTDPYPLYTYIDLGNLYFREKQWDITISTFLKAVNYRLSMKAFYEGNLKKELYNYKDEPEVQNAIKKLIKKKVDEKDMKIYDYPLFLKLINDDKMLAIIYDKIGYSYAMKNDLLNAIPYFHKALKIFPDYKPAKQNLNAAVEQQKNNKQF